MTAPTRQLGPWLGVVAGPRPRPTPGEVNLDAIRLALVDRLVEQAGALDPDWLEAWRPAVAAAAGQALAELRARAEEAALASRAPDRVARHAVPDPDDVRILLARIGSAGIPLEHAVAAVIPGTDPGRAFRTIGGAVEESWLELEAMVAIVVTEWAPRTEAVAEWRRPTTALWVVTGLVLAVTAVAGLAIGGYLAAPGWFQPVITLWWSLPWP